MGFTIDIDTGGTFTDGLFTDGTVIKRVKVDTTPHDITESWLTAIRQGAIKFGFPTVRDFMEQVDIVRWSNTTATNIIAEKKGPKIGLFVTEGYRDSLYSASNESPAFGRLVDQANIEVVRLPLDGGQLVLQLKRLLEAGVRRICISLKDGLKNLKDEIQLKNIFEEQYPDHYLGNVPFLSAGDICKHPDDMTRTHVALMNSYVHDAMARAMFKAEDDLRERGYLGALLLGHVDGGVARVAKTKPVDTIESGPIFGVHAAAFWAEKYKLENVITLDVGGTTTKVGVVENFRPAMVREGDILDVPLKRSMIDLRSIALGGGTIARVLDGKLKLGPRSMGAYPGPACYDLGGTEPTLTDAYLTKGFLDPEYFAGGTRKINVEAAMQAVGGNIAEALDLDPHVAAYKISDLATEMIADEISKVIARRGKDAKEYTLFAFGGNGGMVGCEVAQKVGIEKVYLFSLGSVFSSFGSSVADVSHTYDYAPYLPASNHKELGKIVRRMMEDAVRDMEGEGFDPQGVETELEISFESERDVKPMIFPWTIDLLDNGDISQTLKKTFLKGGLPQEALDRIIDVLKLRVKSVVAKIDPVDLPVDAASTAPAEKGARVVYRGSEKVITKLYDWDKLKPGNVIDGHALMEGEDTTHVVPRNWRFVMDAFGNGALYRRSK
jgi:N-methylhydantoinase A/oxoprolinase/acetone carboxylase beta subunit